jgi:hydroxypyruvate isomerase
MPRFAANLSLLFANLPFPERFSAARAAGFEAVECQFPYAWEAEAIAAQLQQHHLQMVLHNLPGGDTAAGERGIACIPGREAEFRASVAQGIYYAQTLGCPQLNCLAGILPHGVPAADARACLIENLRHAAAETAGAGLRLLTEPINHHDVPGFFLNTMMQGADLLDAVGSPNLYLQYDLYHAQRMTGELAATAQRHLARIAHIQIADNPGRHEPGTGEIHHDFLFRHLDAIGYTGWIGCEYLPLGDTLQGLGWMRPWAEQAAPGTPIGTP